MDLSINQSFAIVRNAYNQIAGITPLAVLDSTNFASVASTVRRIGYNSIIPGLMEQFGKLMYKEIPYQNHFPNMFESMESYGVDRGKGQFVTSVDDQGSVDGAGFAEEDTSYSQVGEGKTFGTYRMHFEKPVEFFWTGKNVFMAYITFTRKQLRQAFASPEAMQSYLTAKVTKLENDINQQMEAIARTALNDFIASRIYLDRATSGTYCIHAITEYNAKYGTNFTYDTICADNENYAKFCRFLAVTTDEAIADLGERDVKYHVNPTTHPINPGYILQHSSPDRLKMYRLRKFDKEIKAQGLVDTRNLDMIPTQNMTTVNYWQSNNTDADKSKVLAKSKYMTSDGTTANMANPEGNNYVYAVIMDKDALKVGMVDSWTQETPMDAEKGVSNRYYHYEFETRRDDTEKAIVILLD